MDYLSVLSQIKRQVLQKFKKYNKRYFLLQSLQNKPVAVTCASSVVELSTSEIVHESQTLPSTSADSTEAPEGMHPDIGDRSNESTLRAIAAFTRTAKMLDSDPSEARIRYLDTMTDKLTKIQNTNQAMAAFIQMTAGASKSLRRGGKRVFTILHYLADEYVSQFEASYMSGNERIL